jgi:hypothetical protein
VLKVRLKKVAVLVLEAMSFLAHRELIDGERWLGIFSQNKISGWVQSTVGHKKGHRNGCPWVAA